MFLGYAKNKYALFQAAKLEMPACFLSVVHNAILLFRFDNIVTIILYHRGCKSVLVIQLLN